MMRHVAIAALALNLAVAASAQDAGPRGDGGGPAANWGPRQWLTRMLEGFDHELGFDEQQWTQLEPIVAAQEARAQEAFARWREVGQAMAAGEEARAAALREQLQQQFEQSEGGMSAMFDEIETILREDQLDRFVEMRRMMGQWREHGRQMWQAVRDLPDAVGMSDQQRQDYQALLRERWQAMQEEMRQRGEQGAGSMWKTPDFAALREEFFGQVAQLLTRHQQELLNEYRLQFVSKAQPAEDPPPEDVRRVLQAMKRVRGLSSEQYDALREIERDARTSYHDLRRDEPRLAQLASDVKARIIKVLEPEQVEQFKRDLDRLRPRRGRE